MAEVRRVVRLAGRAKPEPHPWRQTHHVEPVVADAQDPPRGLGRRVAPDDDGRRVTQQLRAEALPEPARDRALETFRQFPRCEVEERDHDGQPRGDREWPAADRVVDRAGRAAAFRAPRRSDGRAAQQERVEGQRA